MADIKVSTDLDIINSAMETVNTITHTVESDTNVNNLITVANKLITSEFIVHMTDKAVSEPKRFAHMYEWNRVGDPNQRLWKNILSGSGKNRTMSFDFVASKTSVPVAPKLKQVGVQQNHIFVWKAMVLELGMPVNISPTLAKVLVFEDSSDGHAPHRINGGTKSWINGGIIYYPGTISIERAGNAEQWGAFTETYAEWMGGDGPVQAMAPLSKMTTDTIKNTFFSKLKQLATGKRKNKTFSLKPIGLDPSFQATLQTALNRNYDLAAATRKVETDV